MSLFSYSTNQEKKYKKETREGLQIEKEQKISKNWTHLATNQEMLENKIERCFQEIELTDTRWREQEKN